MCSSDLNYFVAHINRAAKLLQSSFYDFYGPVDTGAKSSGISESDFHKQALMFHRNDILTDLLNFQNLHVKQQFSAGQGMVEIHFHSVIPHMADHAG